MGEFTGRRRHSVAKGKKGRKKKAWVNRQCWGEVGSHNTGKAKGDTLRTAFLKPRKKGAIALLFWLDGWKTTGKKGR